MQGKFYSLVALAVLSSGCGSDSGDSSSSTTENPTTSTITENSTAGNSSSTTSSSTVSTGTTDYKSFTRDNVREVVLDRTTGLMWQDTAKQVALPEGIYINDYNITDYPKIKAEIDRLVAKGIDRTSLESNIGTNGNHKFIAYYNYYYCNDLNISGLDNWRVPEYDEIKGIVDSSNSPTIVSIFKNTKPWGYWHNPYSIARYSYTYVLNFNTGQTEEKDSYKEYYFRCVRTMAVEEFID